ncbi:hypothetical protein BH18ACT5_BH18ACT5_05830 [soil metagenome]
MTRPITCPKKSPRLWLKRSSPLFLGLVLACAGFPLATSTSSTFATTSIVENTLPPSTTARIAFDRGDLETFEPVEIVLGETRHWVAVADTEAERGQGLMDVDDVGDFLGLLFVWEEEINTGFFMKDTLMPLDLFFYGASGDLVDQVSLVPCGEEPCPVYVSDARFQWVLETPAGNLAPPLGPLTVSAVTIP